MTKPQSVVVEVAVDGAERHSSEWIRGSSRTSLGRNEDSDICVSDATLSRHHEDLSYEDRGLGAICQATNALVAHQPLPEFFGKVLEAVLDSIPGQRTAIVLVDGQPPVPTVKATRTRSGAEIGAIRLDIVQRALEERKAILVRDIFGSADSWASLAVSVHPVRSVLCAPLWSTTNKKGDGRLLGLVYLDSQRDRPPLTDRDLHILMMLANITATKIENARLLEASVRNQRIEDDVQRAAEIQSELLPRCSPTIDGYCVCGSTKPCRMVGGDYFDFENDGKSLHMALADVSGKGTGAAMLTVALRATVRAHWRWGDLNEATARINQTFHENVPPDRYATFFLARLDPDTGRLEYVNAGHNRPLLIRPNGQWSRLEVGGTVLGAFADSTYDQDTVVLEPGACLIVFSDGISDAWPDQDEADRHLVDFVLARKRGEVAALRAEIFSAVDRTNDDRTLIIVERLARDVRQPC
jgi:phosphoserine phosphatase RsbU/P